MNFQEYIVNELSHSPRRDQQERRAALPLELYHRVNGRMATVEFFFPEGFQKDYADALEALITGGNLVRSEGLVSTVSGDETYTSEMIALSDQ